MKYMISYDLEGQGKDYEGLIGELRRLGAKKIMASQWVLTSDLSADELLRRFLRFIDPNDRLLINSIESYVGVSVNLLSSIDDL